MRFIFLLLIFSSFAFVRNATDLESTKSFLVKKLAKNQTTRISREIVISGPCVANNRQLIHTCNRVKKGSRDTNSKSDKPISISRIYYLQTFVKKLEEYENYPN